MFIGFEQSDVSVFRSMSYFKFYNTNWDFLDVKKVFYNLKSLFIVYLHQLWADALSMKLRKRSRRVTL